MLEVGRPSNPEFSAKGLDGWVLQKPHRVPGPCSREVRVRCPASRGLVTVTHDRVIVVAPSFPSCLEVVPWLGVRGERAIRGRYIPLGNWSRIPPRYLRMDAEVSARLTVDRKTAGW